MLRYNDNHRNYNIRDLKKKKFNTPSLHVRGLCAMYVWLAQTAVNENTTNLERVMSLCLT